MPAGLRKIAGNLVNIGQSLGAILNLHPMPRRFQNAAASSSDTTTLWRAFEMAARSSSDKT
jgi:hypothetical protein